MLRYRLPAEMFEDLAVPFECVAASIERARENCVQHGKPDRSRSLRVHCRGVPPVRIGDEHFFDGGLGEQHLAGSGSGPRRRYSVGLARRASRGGPRRAAVPVEVAFVAFEISRRHRFHSDLERVDPGITVHVLPTGLPQWPAATWSNLRYRETARLRARRVRLPCDTQISGGVAVTTLRRTVTVPLAIAFVVCVLV